METIAAGYNLTLGIQRGGRVFAVGESDEGQCEVDNWSSIEAVAAGRFHSLGVRSGGTLAVTGELPANNEQIRTWSGGNGY